MTSASELASPQTLADSDLLKDLYTDWSEIMATTPGMTTRLLRSIFDELHQSTKEPEDVSYKEEAVGAVAGIWALPKNADASRVLLYTHGGGFAVGSAASHRKVAGHVAKALGVTAFVPDYRLAPENPHPAGLEDSVAVYEALLERGVRSEDITSIGDSAGGNLAIATSLALRDKGLPLPGRVIVFSPWLDMENSGETIITNDATDALFSLPLLQVMVAGVLGDTVNPKNPLANPLHADFDGFPKLYITAGSGEMLLDNATRLNDAAKSAGVDVTLSVADGQQHIFPMSAGRSAVADETIRKIADWYRS
jgi:monoterpene epsilon-lactone hydrolase